MQETRQYILEILRTVGDATVGEIVEELCKKRGQDITAVTVRHHLGVLQDDGLIEVPQMLHRDTPGRPQHVYRLTQKATTYLPNNYQRLSQGLIQQVRSLVPDQINVIFEGIADQMAQEALIPEGTVADRIEAVVSYLNDHGYEASFESVADGYLLHTSNCPYHDLAQGDEALCKMDMRLITTMLGVVPRMIAHKTDGADTCSYHIPTNRN